MPPTLDELTQELGRFIEGAEDVCAVAWDKRAQPRLKSGAARCLRVLGVDAKGLRGRPAGDLFVGGERAARDLSGLCVAKGASVQRPLFRLGGASAGQQFPARLTLRNVRGGTIALIRDLSASAGESDATLRAADLARFASLLAHEVRNPLSAVKIALQTIERHGRMQPNDMRRAEIAIREVGNIELLLNEVLEFARPPTLARVPIDPGGPVREATDELAAQWRGRGVRVRLELPERRGLVQADPTRIRTAARLLLRLGALAAEEAGGGDVVISLRDLAPKEPGVPRRWTLSVRDPGRALTQEAREQAFVPFHPSRARGSGVALAVVERIAREHGGEVTLSEAPGGGNVVAMTMSED